MERMKIDETLDLPEVPQVAITGRRSTSQHVCFLERTPYTLGQ